MPFLQKTLLFIKKYWHIFLIIGGALAAFIFLRKRDTSFIDELRKVQESHDEEIKQINLVREEERRQHAENLRRRDEALAVVQKQYDENMQQLDSKKKKEIEKLVKEHGNDPEALAKQLSELTGFTVILPN